MTARTDRDLIKAVAPLGFEMSYRKRIDPAQRLISEAIPS